MDGDGLGPGFGEKGFLPANEDSLRSSFDTNRNQSSLLTGRPLQVKQRERNTPE